jgi:TonB family protein
MSPGVDICSVYRPRANSLLLLTLALLLLPSVAAWCQQDQTDSNRKVVSRVEPEYPHLARTMNITGVVRLEALVAGSGTVKMVQIKGGHPVLAEAAVAAVNRWKWERTPQDTKETVEIKFTPQ